MNQHMYNTPEVFKSDEGGSARLKFLVVMILLGAIAYAGYLYLPVRVQAYQFQGLMQHYVDMAVVQGYKPDWVRDQLVKSAPEYGVPADAIITPTQRNNRVEVTVQFARPIEFPGYTYQYEFDYTAKSTAFLTIK